MHTKKQIYAHDIPNMCHLCTVTDKNSCHSGHFGGCHQNQDKDSTNSRTPLYHLSFSPSFFPLSEGNSRPSKTMESKTHLSINLKLILLCCFFLIYPLLLMKIMHYQSN
ncbi:hypothetical protein CIPAW_16G094200 [Carya illinoinensis]|uniref:Uncharacterized protein n=1 Tax=Carya illinoinensis TaxID=32201 RepID=A0A8T1N511_CARIL|nr:hypothetical protein CIPAW_16G094200 [Carya illinoinensis]